MKYVISLGIVLVVAFLAWFFIAGKDNGAVLPVETKTPDTTVRVATPYGFAYTYREHEYRVYEHTDTRRGNLVHMESLIDTDDYKELNASDTPREMPVALSMQVYRNPMHTETREWITQNDASNYQLSADGTIKSVQLGTTEYLSYQFDGLYRTDAYVYGKDGYMYVFFNSWDNPQSAMKKDMENVLASMEWSEPSIPATVAHGDIVLQTPTPNAEVSSPLRVEGIARGGWYFEASFPLIVVDWDGRIIGEGHAEAQGDWMTDDFVPFVGTIEFQKPEGNNRGSLILQKSNASGLPEHDDAIEVTIMFK